MYNFKLYNENDEALFFTSIADLANYCGVSRKEASKAVYRNVTTLNGISVINYSF